MVSISIQQICAPEMQLQLEMFEGKCGLVTREPQEYRFFIYQSI